ncbi:hypothetical protein SAMN04488056_112163 [Cohaesibacter marisflavi]|uniref:Uncharacterized protein n=1 Tax=Cohaesibacter marisflavi TaxID=655353 RepID=A0A1I5JYA7_9HYPH|nr:hypothetical protein [Cohaesibacter marisflavi]SFO77792.1 hypothetical protein SAMN04488056_112163 [Cohaesibacter marisflavi]
MCVKDGFCSCIKQFVPEVPDYFLLYWKNYGGWIALVKSIYLWSAIIFSFMTYPIWLNLNEMSNSRAWHAFASNIAPSLLGFSIGAFAIFLAFNGKTLRLLMENGDNNSYFMDLSVSFFHFIFSQVLSIVLLIFSVAYETSAFFSFFGYLVFIYSLLVGLSAAGNLLNVAWIMNLALGPSDGDNAASEEHNEG